MKKKIALAMLSTALGAALVGAGSFAIFTSSAQNTNNTFTAGTLNISLDKPDGTKYFDITNMAPGDSGSAPFTVTNNGSLELRYDLTGSLTGALAAGANGLKVTIKDSAGNVITPGDTNRVLAAGASETLTISWALPLAAGNEYQGTTAQFGVFVAAEQTRNN
ncbi:MAG TPA: TasA family protein [Bacilli bacterium]|nr:TasA family protein [Bacilli bacterium]